MYHILGFNWILRFVVVVVVVVVVVSWFLFCSDKSLHTATVRFVDSYGIVIPFSTFTHTSNFSFFTWGYPFSEPKNKVIACVADGLQ